MCDLLVRSNWVVLLPSYRQRNTCLDARTTACRLSIGDPLLEKPNLGHYGPPSDAGFHTSRGHRDQRVRLVRRSQRHARFLCARLFDLGCRHHSCMRKCDCADNSSDGLTVRNSQCRVPSMTRRLSRVLHYGALGKSIKDRTKVVSPRQTTGSDEKP